MSRTVSFHRVVKEPLTLSDGVHLPKGTHFGLGSHNDEDATEEFNGLRYYNKRLKHEESHLHQFVTTDKNNPQFGHGIYACPGRFYATLEMKLILVKLLQNYDFKLPSNLGRPPNLSIYHYLFPDPKGELLIKERAASDRS